MEFWLSLQANYPIIKNFIDYGEYDAVEKMMNILKSDIKNVELTFTIGLINSKPTNDENKNILEIYISPAFKYDNIKYMEKLYEDRNHIRDFLNKENILISKYMPFHFGMEIPIKYEIDSQAFVNVSDIKYQCEIVGIRKDDKNVIPKVDIVIFITSALSNKLLKKEIIKGRSVLIPSNCIMDRILLNIIGEFNLLHNVNHIEFINEDTNIKLMTLNDIAYHSNNNLKESKNIETIKPNKNHFKDIKFLREDLLLICKRKYTLKCNNCDKYSIQTDLLFCTKCRKIMYCSQFCMNMQKKYHLEVCNGNFSLL